MTTTAESRNWAIAAHLSAFLGALITLAFVGPLVVWLIKRENDPFVERHAREALNFNLTMFALLVVGLVLFFITLGLALIVLIPVGSIVGLLWVVFTIVGAVKGANGEEYRYPLSLRVVR